MGLAAAIGLAFLISCHVMAQDACSTMQEEAASSQLGTACGSPVSVCLCNYRLEDQYISQDVCSDYMIYCSDLDATSCGSQRSWTNYYDDGTVTYGYEWSYNSGAWTGIRLISFRNYDQVTCSFQIYDDNAGTSFDCRCGAKSCSADNSEVWYIDCSGYAAGAYADGCLGDTWGITSGVLEGWAIPSGLCTAESNNNDPPVKQPRGGVEANTGKTAGIVVGVLVLVVGFGVGVWYHRKSPEDLSSFVTSFFRGLMLGSRNRHTTDATPVSPPVKGSEEANEPSDSAEATGSSESASPSNS